MDSVCEGVSHFGLLLTFAPRSGWGPAETWEDFLAPPNVLGSNRSLVKHPSRHELIWVSIAWSFSAASSKNLNKGHVKVCRSLCWKPPLLSRQNSTWGHSRSVNGIRLTRSLTRFSDSSHKDVSLPSKLMDEACVTSARCAWAALWYTSFGSQCACGIFPFTASEFV